MVTKRMGRLAPGAGLPAAAVFFLAALFLLVPSDAQAQAPRFIIAFQGSGAMITPLGDTSAGFACLTGARLAVDVTIFGGARGNQITAAAGCVNRQVVSCVAADPGPPVIRVDPNDPTQIEFEPRTIGSCRLETVQIGPAVPFCFPSYTAAASPASTWVVFCRFF